MATLTTFKYTLDKSSRKFRCPQCEKKRFVRYRNNESGEYLPADIGRCDRELECGYHKPLRKADGIDVGNALYSSPKPPEQPKVSTLPIEYLKRSQGNYEANTLIKWLITLFGWDIERAEGVAKLYKVGTSNDGWAIFWQVDEAGKVRSGKMMRYNETGHRVKDSYSQDWIHSKLQRVGKLKNFKLVQCLFGLHIVDDSKPVAIVESEKTAIIASQYLPQLHWLASGMLQGINEYKLRPLRGKNITLFPDIGAYELWTEKATEYGHMAKIQVSDLLEYKAPEQHRGYDMADYLIQYDLRDFTSPYGWNPYTDEIFDSRGYPRYWDDIASPEPGSPEFAELIKHKLQARG